MRSGSASARTAAVAFAAFVCAAALGPAALADIITFTDGSKIEGKVIEDIAPGPCGNCVGTGKTECAECGGKGNVKGVPCATCNATGKVPCKECSGSGRDRGKIVVMLKGGGLKVTFSKRDVASVERKEVPAELLMSREERYRKRLGELQGADAKGQFELGRWCFENNFGDRAYKHFSEATRLDRRYARQVGPFVEILNSRFDAAAKREVDRALSRLAENDFLRAADELDKIVAGRPRAPFLSDSRAQEAFLRNGHPKILAAYGTTLRAVASAARRRAKTACSVCKGGGKIPCPKCGGSGNGVCPKCEGVGRAVCDNCNGTGRELCPRCLGTGKEQGGGVTMTLARVCTRCRGRKTVECTSCKGKRFAVCDRCGGLGKVKGGCKRCEGTGALSCPACLGTGRTKVSAFRWGPVPNKLRHEVIVVGRKGLKSVWQGSHRGAIVTVAPSELLFSGALRSQLNAVLGKGCRYLVACVDNREGARQIRFSSAERTVRLVLDDATQVEIIPAAEMARKLSGDEDLKKAAAQMEDAEILPGVMGNIIAVVPGEVDPKRIRAAYWGRADPWRLEHRYLDEQEAEALRKALR